MRKKHIITVITVLSVVLLLHSLVIRNGGISGWFGNSGVDNSLSAILDRGTLRVVAEINSTDYYIINGEPGGFQYDLLKSYADSLGVRLEIETKTDIGKAMAELNEGKADLLAMGLPVTGTFKKTVDFTLPIIQTRQVLVQRKPDGWRKMASMEQVENLLIRNPIQLAGKEVYVPGKSAYISRLVNLAEETGEDIIIVETPETVEGLIAMVADKKINYTVCNENLARVVQRNYPDLDVETPVGFQQNIAWALKPGSESLKNNINNWLLKAKDEKFTQHLYNKYFVYAHSSNKLHRKNRLSVWDDLLKEKSREIHWDWRLVASLVYQESRFKADALGLKGAFGLMQLMPGTAKKYGIDHQATPEENVDAGIRYLKYLENKFRRMIPDPEQRTKFVLASYNAGIAHVLDARRLAKKYGKNPDIWDDNVDHFLINKDDPMYYNDSLVKYGSFSGQISANFVTDILKRFEHYKNIVQ